MSRTDFAPITEVASAYFRSFWQLVERIDLEALTRVVDRLWGARDRGATLYVAGNGGFCDGTGGPNGTAEFNGPSGLAVDSNLSALYVNLASALSALHTAVADHLTSEYGQGPWSAGTSEKGVLHALRVSRVFAAREGAEIVGTLRLTTRKPWAIDTSYFTACRTPLYLLAMAIAPARQRQGIGKWCLEEAKRLARAWPAEALRLDAYDAPAGAGPFYARCGFTEVGRASYRRTPLIYYELALA